MALARGVRRARVITTSSGFFCVLFSVSTVVHRTRDVSAHIAESPEFPEGFRWFKIELKRSVMVVFVVFCSVSRVC